MENSGFDEFDIMAARDWINALTASQEQRKSLDRLNNQIQTVPTKDYIQMLTGIGMLADILGAELKEGVTEEGESGLCFSYQGRKFFQTYPPQSRAEA